jgi:two-component system response regulator YesN
MKTLVVIDDEIEMEELYGLMLRDYIDQDLLSYKFFSDARSFVEWINANKASLVLCDLNMPYLSGIEVGRIIRQKDPSARLFFVSGHEASDFKDVMNELNVERFLSKPLDYEEILDSIISELGL